MFTDITTLILTTARDRFQITAVKPFQLLVIQRIVEQDTYKEDIRDQLVILPTGTGKSLCFMIPALICSGITIIVYPLLALMNDQISKLKKLNIKCANLRGGQTKQQRQEAFSSLNNGCKIVITNPETLCQNKILSELAKHSISLFVCDEAHVISQWGKSFRPSYGKLGSVINKLNPRQVLGFTATAGSQTINEIKRVLFRHNPLIVKGDADRENIIYRSFPAHDRTLGVLQILWECEKPAIVFCPTRASTFEVCRAAAMTFKDTQVRYYNAGLTKPEREKLENWFLHSRNGILVTTNAYGMGVDKKEIRTVIHYSLPSSVEAYLQESGRSGRDGKDSTSYVVITDEDKVLDNTLQKIFCGNGCRRSALLHELGQEKAECTGCDVCLGEVLTNPKEDRIIINALKKHPFRYTSLKLASILTGNTNTGFVTLNERIDPYFGLLNNYDEKMLEQSILSIAKTINIPFVRKYLYYKKRLRKNRNLKT